MKRGAFWLIDDNILAIPYDSESYYGVAKSGDDYNHCLLWDYVKPKKCNKPFDYYPRGRVEIDNKGRPVIYMNKNIDESYIPVLVEKFEIEGTPRIHYDGSEHYKSSFD